MGQAGLAGVVHIHQWHKVRLIASFNLGYDFPFQPGPRASGSRHRSLGVCIGSVSECSREDTAQ